MKFDINQEHPEKIGHDLISLHFIKDPVLTLFTSDGCIPSFSCVCAD